MTSPFRIGSGTEFDIDDIHAFKELRERNSQSFRQTSSSSQAEILPSSLDAPKIILIHARQPGQLVRR